MISDSDNILKTQSTSGPKVIGKGSPQLDPTCKVYQDLPTNEELIRASYYSSFNSSLVDVLLQIDIIPETHEDALISIQTDIHTIEVAQSPEVNSLKVNELALPKPSNAKLPPLPIEVSKQATQSPGSSNLRSTTINVITTSAVPPKLPKPPKPPMAKPAPQQIDFAKKAVQSPGPSRYATTSKVITAVLPKPAISTPAPHRIEYSMKAAQSSGPSPNTTYNIKLNVCSPTNTWTGSASEPSILWQSQWYFQPLRIR
eukprot:CAMPEP_0170127036 /NCGR_PEP_ID=MMETSP0020_2-20130122/20151_1 /TAXON_ID=98059 /ORGANISM="Dinobryon sp., Strain UTEXLB2267" /LENGTH=256 /DNA_ID=CAMNT_0010360319 /DNA_START=128 /DNA_END=895 /DNA_ORIENTATION=-